MFRFPQSLSQNTAMAAAEVSGRETVADALRLGPTPESLRNKVKFLCSHGGKILPRHTDGILKYVGGETRIVSVPRDINFSGLMKKLASISGGDIILKYQLIPEDLDALVTVKSDADFRHMMDEHDRYETSRNRDAPSLPIPSHPNRLRKPNQMHGTPCTRAALHRRYQRHSPSCTRIAHLYFLCWLISKVTGRFPKEPAP
ncbi:protein PAL OF QUIRKY-like [Actinidia eriantha]|uniref:protein PAL OF QUIRKY-like n=1 Tax=Actinidia eriantha TaxID=165200 RepID=UPI00258ABE14|nr:protein PAL OF QUIRKY-like [Actinidia eriantha]